MDTSRESETLSENQRAAYGNRKEESVKCDQEEEEDESMLIEQLGRDYLCRNNTIRRHTIGTNADKEPGSDIVKSTECLLMLDENEETKYEQQTLFKQFVNPPLANQHLLDTKYIIPTVASQKQQTQRW